MSHTKVGNPFLGHRRDSEHFRLSQSGCRRAAELKMLCIIMREWSQRVATLELIVSTSSASLHSIFTAQAQAKSECEVSSAPISETKTSAASTATMKSRSMAERVGN